MLEIFRRFKIGDKFVVTGIYNKSIFRLIADHEPTAEEIIKALEE